MISVENVSRRYGQNVALAPTTLAFRPRATTVLIGPSGCGKSTLLRIIMGLIRPDTGIVRIGDAVLTPKNVNALRHTIGYVIQDGGLFPHLTAEKNVTLLPRYLHIGDSEIRERLRYLTELTRLPESLLSRYPGELSGGQRQRVGLLRALMLDPPALVLDEPLGALDPITRFELQAELKGIFARLEKTVILVTHDMGEAAYFGDEIVLMRAGQVVQSGALQELLQSPADPYVAEFIRAQRAPLPAAAPEASA